jgi:hypothetical protein
VTLENASPQDEVIRILALTPSGPTVVANLSAARLGPRAFLVIAQASLTPFGSAPLLVQSTGPLAAMQEAAPAGMPGVIAMSGVPLG